jgi:chaperonin cofactor prefoldin
MLMGERFDSLDRRIETVATDLDVLARSHARLGERVAEIEGYLRAATGAPFRDKPRIEKK